MRRATDWVGDVPGCKLTAVAGTVPRTMCCEEALCCRELTVAEDTDRWQE